MLTSVSAICNPILIILLHGNEDFSAEQNFNIINAAHKFIIKSKHLTYLDRSEFFFFVLT